AERMAPPRGGPVRRALGIDLLHIPGSARLVRGVRGDRTPDDAQGYQLRIDHALDVFCAQEPIGPLGRFSGDLAERSPPVRELRDPVYELRDLEEPIVLLD